MVSAQVIDAPAIQSGGGVDDLHESNSIGILRHKNLQRWQLLFSRRTNDINLSVHDDDKQKGEMDGEAEHTVRFEYGKLWYNEH